MLTSFGGLGALVFFGLLVGRVTLGLLVLRSLVLGLFVLRVDFVVVVFNVVGNVVSFVVVVVVVVVLKLVVLGCFGFRLALFIFPQPPLGLTGPVFGFSPTSADSRL